MIFSIELINLLAKGGEETKTTEVTFKVICLLVQIGVNTY